MSTALISKPVHNNASLIDTRKGIDINVIFRWVNWLLFGFTVFFYARNKFPLQINQTSLWLYFFLAVQSHFFLFHEKKRRNPFILLLVFVMVVFTFPRILTLYWFDNSDPFRTLNRIRPTTAADVNNSLLFILISNFFIVLPFFLRRAKSTVEKVTIPVWKIRKVSYFFLGSFILLCLTLVSNQGIFGEGNRVMTVISFFFDAGRILPFALIYMYIVLQETDTHPADKRRKKRLVLLIQLLLLAWVASNYVFGNRSAIITMIQNLLILSIVMGRNLIPKKVLFGVIIMVVISIPLFFIGTISRSVRINKEANFSFADNIKIVMEAAPVFFESGEYVEMLTPAFERASYLDYTVDLMKNRSVYKSVVNVEQYFKSTIDALTPGFDVFNTPKSANALIYIYGTGGVQQRTILPGEYQSDQFNVYGELYVAYFGWWSLPLFALFTAVFWRTYTFFRRPTTRHIIWKFFVISQFFNWLRSFGTDWFVVYAIYEFLAYAFFIYLFEHKFYLRNILVDQDIKKSIDAV